MSLHAGPDQDVAAADEGEIGLGGGVAVAEGGEQGGVETTDAGQILRVHAVALGVVFVDQAQLAGVRHVDLMTAVLEQARDPGRVGAGLEDQTRRGHAREAPLQGCRRGAQAGLLDELAIRIDRAQLRVVIAQV